MRRFCVTFYGILRLFSCHGEACDISVRGEGSDLSLCLCRRLKKSSVFTSEADGKINEREYLVMYPALIEIFDYDFDFQSVKQEFCHGGTRKILNEYTERMLRVFDCLDGDLADDTITLCLCVTAADGKISLREKRYIKRLFRA